MEKIIILKSGKKIPVIREDEKYLYCKGTQFKRNHPDISDIKGESLEEGYEKIPDMEAIEKEISSEEMMVENIAAESNPKAKKKTKREE